VTDVPPGLDARPLTTSDAQAAFAVLAAADEADLGFVGIDLDDVVADWGRPSFSLQTDSVGVFEGERLVGCIEVYKGSRAVGAVHPNHRERGIGTALVAWSEEHARAKGSTTLAHAMAETSAGPDLLSRRGYQHRHTAWILRLGTGDDIIGDRNLPPGVAIRPMQAGEEQGDLPGRRGRLQRVGRSRPEQLRRLGRHDAETARVPAVAHAGRHAGREGGRGLQPGRER
jgi:GNAT superfamily N-acetyltransferase